MNMLLWIWILLQILMQNFHFEDPFQTAALNFT